ncbi:hypothetical protein Q8A67_020431 [Cirrhinus molitorella]|uniref:PH domain-containing protein n=1 Tax=Cirrhinus molitorella TaxID=172907 RepID=A0AA88TFD4_9TELE|nr:hypothetical protein Q8A67_020431 [Cirrhinus molitorella]
MSSKKKPIMGEELYFGYLLKSPPPASLTKNAKLWKHYFFVLSKTSEDSYQLTYHANHERRDKTLRAIDIAKIILFFIGPESHPKWEWIQKNFKCPPSSVLFLKVEEDTTKSSRDYFLIGENSDDVNGWFSALFEIPVIENIDEKDGNQDESPKKSSIYMSMTSVHFSVFICQFYQDHSSCRKHCCETHRHVENDMCSSQNDLESLISTQEERKPCVSQWRQIQDSRADWILQNAVEGIHKCLKTLSRDEAKLLLQQFPGLDVYDTEDKIQNLVQILSPPAKQ